MFHFVVYSSQLIRRMKNLKVSVSHAKFVNDEKYRHSILDQARGLNDKECSYLADLIAKENI